MADDNVKRRLRSYSEGTDAFNEQRISLLDPLSYHFGRQMFVLSIMQHTHYKLDEGLREMLSP